MRTSNPMKHLSLAMGTILKIAQAVVDGAPLPQVFYPERSVELRFFGECVAKERPRSTANGHTYTPKKTVDYEKAVAALGAAAMLKRGLAPFRCPLLVHATFYAGIPKAWGRDQRLLAPLLRPWQKDVDNLVKAVLDGLNGVMFYDDNQVVQIFASKAYVVPVSGALGMAEPGFTLGITPVGVTANDVENILKAVAQIRKASK